MVTWERFTEEAPHISEVFARRHAATHKLCMLGTIRSDGAPRISPIEPNVFGGQLVLVGMPGTTKFHDLAREPRFCLHTSTVDPQLGDGDAKLWGTAVHLDDGEFHQGFAAALFEETGMDLRGEKFDPFYVAEITSASSIELAGNKLKIAIWKPGEAERFVEKT